MKRAGLLHRGRTWKGRDLYDIVLLRGIMGEVVMEAWDWVAFRASYHM
jgi:hypothetical protein